MTPAKRLITAAQQAAHNAQARKQARKIRVQGNVAYVPLTKGYEAVIDASDVPLVEGVNWHALVGKNTVYAVRNDYTGDKLRKVWMHRVVLGDPEGFQVDHKDGDGLHNRRKNLREATRVQNQHNRRISRANTSGFKGVSFHNQSNKWLAQIGLNGKRKSLGLHDTAEQAHAAYVEASAKFHGQFGRAQ